MLMVLLLMRQLPMATDADVVLLRAKLALHGCVGMLLPRLMMLPTLPRLLPAKVPSPAAVGATA